MLICSLSSFDTLALSDVLSGCVVYVFEDDGGFFIEQPYHGVFSIEENQYIEISGSLFQRSSFAEQDTQLASKVFWSQKTPGGDSDESPPFA